MSDTHIHYVCTHYVKLLFFIIFFLCVKCDPEIYFVLSSSPQFLKEELQYAKGYEKRQKVFHSNNDQYISVRELWHMWKKSEVSKEDGVDEIRMCSERGRKGEKSLRLITMLYM